ASLIISVLTLAWTLRGLWHIAPSSLLAGATPSSAALRPLGRRRWSMWIAAGAFAGAAALTVAGFFVKDSEAQAGTFFGSGALLLAAGLAALWAWMRRPRGETVTRFSVPGLALRNGTRNPLRSLLTAGLLAAAAFLIVAVDLFRQGPGADSMSKD